MHFLETVLGSTSSGSTHERMLRPYTPRKIDSPESHLKKWFERYFRIRAIWQVIKTRVKMDPFIDSTDSGRKAQNFICDCLIQIDPCYGFLRIAGKLWKADFIASCVSSAAAIVFNIVHAILAGMVVIFENQRQPKRKVPCLSFPLALFEELPGTNADQRANDACEAANLQNLHPSYRLNVHFSPRYSMHPTDLSSAAAGIEPQH